MRDWDWLKAIYLGCLGFVLSPFVAFAWFQLEMQTGIGILGSILNHHVPFAIYIGPIVLIIYSSIFGAAAGFFWGLLGEQVRDWVYDLSALLHRKFFSRDRKSQDEQ